jgi:hypothetical protein
MKTIFRMAALGLAVLLGSAGFAVAQDWRYDRDDYGYGRGYARGPRVAHEIGYRDGSQVAREDMWHRKPFNPYPRGQYRRADHGYNRWYGDRDAYRERYADGYRDGYVAAFRGNRGYDHDDYRWRR